jgi:hypothetical protein
MANFVPVPEPGCVVLAVMAIIASGKLRLRYARVEFAI